jgi:hypothetical protein
MPDYSQGKIYTIRCRNDPSLIYVGSTIQSLAKRFGEHRRHSKQEKNKKTLLYNEIEDWDDWYIELYLNFPCKSVEELRQKEGEIIREIGTLNKNIAGQTEKEWRNENKETLQIQINKWKKDNPEKMKIHREKDKIREIETGRCEVRLCECGGRFSLKSIREHERSKKHQNYLQQLTPPP